MILLFGDRGYIGRAFAAFFQARGISFRGVGRADVDHTDVGSLKQLLRDVRPDFVINAAGVSGHPTVDACESARAETLAGNVVFPLRLAEACDAHGIPWGHVSSGCIYQGNRGLDADGAPLGFRETDPPTFSFQSPPCSFYSGTKALAEQLLIQGGYDVSIWRLRVPFDAHDGPRNYLSKLMRYPRLLDVRNSLSHLGDFVAAAWATRERDLPRDIYNLTNPGSVTTREVVALIEDEGRRRLAAGDAASAALFLKTYAYFESEAEFMRTVAVAPRSSCVLDTTRAERLGLPLRPIREALVASLREWQWESAT